MSSRKQDIEYNLRVVCISEVASKYYNALNHDIKVGKTYSAFISPDNYHYIISLKGYSCGFTIKHFRTIEEIREEKLNRII